VPVSSCMIRVPSSLAAPGKGVFAQPLTASGGQALLCIDPAAVPRTDKITTAPSAATGSASPWWPMIAAAHRAASRAG
jgi:hypothetical protein